VDHQNKLLPDIKQKVYL